MQHIVTLVDGSKIKLYYNNKVYSPVYSSVDTIVLGALVMKSGATLLDVACGSGVVGLAMKKMFPVSHVTLSDISPEAVRVTKLNAKRLGLSVDVKQCSLLPPGQWHVITANLPTFAPEDMHDLHGPEESYFAGDDPLSLYKVLFNQARDRCAVLVCECQTKYQERFLAAAEKAGWSLLTRNEMAFVLTS